MKEYVQTSARGWKVGVISQIAKPHGACRKCGGAIWFGTVTFKGQEPKWIAYSHAGHGGDGLAVMRKHDCNNPCHVQDRP
jgi:hypothetical protein